MNDKKILRDNYENKLSNIDKKYENIFSSFNKNMSDIKDYFTDIESNKDKNINYIENDIDMKKEELTQLNYYNEKLDENKEGSKKIINFFNNKNIGKISLIAFIIPIS